MDERIKWLTTFAGNFESEKSAPLVDMYCETLVAMLDPVQQQAYDWNTYMYYGRRAIIFDDWINNWTYQLIDPLNPTLQESWERMTWELWSETGKFTLIPWEPKTVIHNLDSGNYHITFFQDAKIVELNIEEASFEFFIVRGDAWNYQYSIIKTPDAEIEWLVSTPSWMQLFDLRTFTLTDTISWWAVSNAILINWFYYIPDRTAGTLKKVDAITNLEVANISVWVCQSISTDYRNLYLTCSDWAWWAWNDYIRKVSVSSFTVIASTLITDYPVVNVVVWDYVYVACYDLAWWATAWEVLKIAKDTLIQVWSINLPNAFDIVQANNNLLVTDYLNWRLYKVDLSSFSIISNINPTGSIGNLMFFRDKVWVAWYSNSSLYEVDPITMIITDTIPAPYQVRKINRHGSTAWVVYYDDNLIEEFNLLSKTFTWRDVSASAPTWLDFF